MTAQLRTLHRLQSIDVSLLEKQREIDRFERQLAERRRAMAECNGRIEALTATRKDLVSQRALAERRVSDQEDMLKEKRQRLGRVRTERELRAGEDEVSSLSEEISDASTLAIELMGKVEEIEAEIETAKAEYANLEEADHRHVSEATAQIERLRRELGAERELREGIAAELDQSVRRRYDRILSARDGIAVVEVIDDCCGGCHMHIPPQTVIEIMKTGTVHVCPSCQRILYVTPPVSEDAAE